jgi:hypothetical protein
MDTKIHQTTATAVRPVHVDLPDEALADLRCIGATRFTDKETVADATQDVQLAIMKVLARNWDTELLDHDTRSYVKMSNAFYVHPVGELTRDEILDNITLYWLTNTGASSVLLYWETKVAALNGPDGSIPEAMRSFPTSTIMRHGAGLYGRIPT